MVYHICIQQLKLKADQMGFNSFVGFAKVLAFTTMNLFFTSLDDVTFAGGFGTSNSVGTAFQMSFDFVSLFFVN